MQLVRLARERPGQLTVLATGPLTNLAAAALLDPELPQLLHSVVIMGGAVRVAGNVLVYPCTEGGDAPSLRDFDPPFMAAREGGRSWSA